MSLTAQTLHRVGLLVIPHPHNDHRPHLLRHKPLAFVSILLILAKITAVGILTLTPATADLSTITTARIIQLTNEERKKKGLNELAVSGLLSNAAAQKGNDMLTYDYFAHISPSGVTPWFWMSKVGYTYQVAGENLAIDFIQAEDVVAAWMASPSHRENLLLPDYTQIGVAVATGEFQGGTSTIVVQMFGKPTKETATAEVVAPSPTPVSSLLGAKNPPTASPSPTPSPSPVIPASSPAPRTPRIALLNPQDTIQQTFVMRIEGTPNSNVDIFINNQKRETVHLAADGSSEEALTVGDLADGKYVVKAVGRADNGQVSGVSDVLTFTKDTVGPELTRQELTFLLSPTTDQPRVWLKLPSHDYAHILFNDSPLLDPRVLSSTWVPVPSPDKPFAITVTDATGNITTLADVTIAPQFATYLHPEEQYAPARLNQLTRRLTAAVGLAIAILLALAILIRIRIQHPWLITHAAFVLVLATALLLL